MVIFRVNGEEVTFDANSIPHYPNEMIRCFVVQLVEKGGEKLRKLT